MTAPTWRTAPEASPARRRTPVAEIFDNTFRLYRQNLVPMVIVYGAFQIPIAVATLPLSALEAHWSQIRWERGDFFAPGGIDLTQMQVQFVPTALAVLGTVAMALMLGTYGLAAISYLAGRGSLGERPTIGQAFRALGGFGACLFRYALLLIFAWFMFWLSLTVIGFDAVAAAVSANESTGGLIALFAVMLLVGLAVVFFVGARLALSIPVLVMEPVSARGAIRRSWVLVTGSTWRTLGLLIIAGIVVGLAGSIITPILVPGMYQGLMTGSFGSYLAITLVTGVLQSIIGPILPTMLVVLYLDYSAPRT